MEEYSPTTPGIDHLADGKSGDQVLSSFDGPAPFKIGGGRLTTRYRGQSQDFPILHTTAVPFNFVCRISIT